MRHSLTTLVAVLSACITRQVMEVEGFASRSPSSTHPVDQKKKDDNGDRTVSTTTSTLSSPLSLSFDELSNVLQGRGRAQIVWECLRQGRDPSNGRSVLWLENHHHYHHQDTADSAADHRLDASSASSPLGQTAQRLYQQAFCTTSPLRLQSVAHVIDQTQAKDGTTKLLLQLTADQSQVETVLIPWHFNNHDNSINKQQPQRLTHSTLCVSSQVGCAQACTFCRTGRMGKLRSLTTDEILMQMVVAQAVVHSSPELYGSIDNVVFMGMGEPADAADAVVTAVQVLTNDQQFQLAPRRVTISTVAPTPEAFVTFGTVPAVLAWSLHAANDTLRQQLVPTTRYSLAELRQALIQTLLQRSRRMRAVMLEVTLLDRLNDTPEAAHELADFVQVIVDHVPAVKVVVNLIPWNDIHVTTGPAAHYRPPEPDRIQAFQQILVAQSGLLCYVRTTRGDDESSACGQLATTTSRTSQHKKV